jgi:hypothetical protein
MVVNDADSLYFEDFSTFQQRDKTLLSDSELETRIRQDPLFPLL